jgi:hypothetical protein
MGIVLRIVGLEYFRRPVKGVVLYWESQELNRRRMWFISIDLLLEKEALSVLVIEVL